MTLVVAIACTNGVVIAADSAASDDEVGTKQPVVKIRRIADQPILYGGSGDGGLLQKIDEDLQALPTRDSLKRIRQEIRKLVIPHQQDAVATHVRYPQQGFTQPPPAILLFAGVLDGKPWIVEVERDGRDTSYGSGMGNFAAIGSGKPWAQAFMRAHLSREKDLQAGKLFACRTIEDAIELAAGGIAEPIRMFTIDADGTVSAISEDELATLGMTCEAWRNLEREAVGQLLAPQPAQPPPEVPMPQPEAS